MVTILSSCPRNRQQAKLSRSTLLRRVGEEGTGQSLLNETRRELAIRYLIKCDLNNQQIAHLVGQRDPNAFQRAFRTWTGMTPRELRKRHLKSRSGLERS